MHNQNSQRERVLLGMLASMQCDSRQSQRRWAAEFGVALGLVNTYLNFCIRKGFVRVKRIPARRYAYYLTPKGMAEKSRLTVSYLSDSLTFFRHACTDCTNMYEHAEALGWTRLALYGTGELADIAILCAVGRTSKLIGILDSSGSKRFFRGLPVTSSVDRLGSFDAVIVADHQNPQGVYDELIRRVPANRLLAPDVLGISRHSLNMATA